MHEIMPETFEFCQFFKQVVLKWLSGTRATLGQARLHTGSFVPRGDAAVPISTKYHWSVRFSGESHSQFSYVSIIVINQSINRLFACKTFKRCMVRGCNRNSSRAATNEH